MREGVQRFRRYIRIASVELAIEKENYNGPRTTKHPRRTATRR